MRNLRRALFVVSLLLMMASVGTCYFGVNHEINKIPPETRVQMADFDWVGSEWIERGMIMFAAAALIGLASLTLWLVERRRRALRSAP